MNPDKVIAKRKEKLYRAEQKSLRPAPPSPAAKAAAPAAGKLADLAPKPAVDTLRRAFEAGFRLIFEKGTPLIEKSYSAQKHRDEYDINRYILSKAVTPANLKRFGRQAGKKAIQNTGISAVEGGVLGVLGIGLPDIPVFIGVILRTVYQICLSYGFDYNSEDERIFILGVICTAAARGEEKAERSARTDRLGYRLDQGRQAGESLEEGILETADRLAGALLAAKFVQGFPLVGAVGGITNAAMIRTVSRTARFKYEKRFLRRAQRDLEKKK